MSDPLSPAEVLRAVAPFHAGLAALVDALTQYVEQEGSLAGRLQTLADDLSRLEYEASQRKSALEREAGKLEARVAAAQGELDRTLGTEKTRRQAEVETLREDIRRLKDARDETTRAHARDVEAHRERMTGLKRQGEDEQAAIRAAVVEAEQVAVVRLQEMGREIAAAERERDRLRGEQAALREALRTALAAGG